MSSRALRKAQKQREEEETLKKLQQEAEELESSEEEADVATKPSAFALLGAGDDEGDEDDDPVEAALSGGDSVEEAQIAPSPAARATKRNKNKKKKGKSNVNANAAKQRNDDSEEDDIDAALQALSTTDKSQLSASGPATDPEMTEACRLLSIDQQNLHAEKEMKRLFGRAALDSNDRDQEANGAGRRRNRNQQMAGLAAALGRRPRAQGGRSSGLGLLGLRRNLFISGKEEWPVGTSGGLGMEVVEKRADGVVEYRFVHNRSYQEIQGDFEICVRGMDPERMVRLLQMNPYHVSTLLQVSEIAKQERDHSTSGDLLERALFTFGRSLHSTFASNLSQGKARLDFRRPENREFWLAVSRYITNLNMRATWRTVFEWAKVLLCLDPKHDPYQIRLVIDQYAIRARQPQQLVDLATNKIISHLWKDLPNIQLSVGLALVQTGQAGKGKQAMFSVANKFPWVIARLFQELNVDAPPGIWGKSPRTAWEKLHTELYAVRAKDIWNTPEASNVLVEVSSAVVGGSPEPPIPTNEISNDEGRHVLLTDKPELIALLPRSITSKLTSASDPLPPDDNLPSYVTSASSQPVRARFAAREDAARELQAIYESFGDLIPFLEARHNEGGRDPGDLATQEDIEEMLRGSGMSRDEFESRARRFTELYHGRMADAEPANGDDDDEDDD